MPTWIRMRDVKTGHEFDANPALAAALVDAKSADPVDDYPVHHGANAREPKARRQIRDLVAAKAADASPAAAGENEDLPTAAGEPADGAKAGRSRRSNRQAAAEPANNREESS